MALDRDAIELIIDAKTDQAEKAERSLQGLGNQVKALKQQLDVGTISQAQFDTGFAKLDAQIHRTRDNIRGLEQDIASMGGKLQGASRVGAKFQVGLAGANIAQDVIQGGPAAGVNNILGLAGNNGVRALAGEWLAAAGGIKAVVAGIGTFTAVATAAFVTVGEGLQAHKLEWSDLGSVIDEMAGGAFSGAWKNISEGFSSIKSDIGGLVGTLAQETIGWGEAADAVRAHKDEVERNTQALKDYQAAAKLVGAVKSDSEKEKEKFGKAFGEEAAELDEGGLKGLIAKLARAQAGAKADQVEDQEVDELDKKGDPTGNKVTRKVTRQQIQEEAITRDFARAIGGDKDAQEALKKRIAGLGLDPTNLGGREAADKAFADQDDKAIENEADDRKRRKEIARNKRKAAEKDDEARDKFRDFTDQEGSGKLSAQQSLRDMRSAKEDKAAKVADEVAAGSNLSGRVEAAMVRSMLAGGSSEDILSRVEDRLATEFEARGMDSEDARDAARKKAVDAYGKVGDDVHAKAMEKLENPEQLKAAQRISAGDFARSVESAGQQAAKKTADNTSKLVEQTAELIRQQGGVAKAG